MAASLLFMLSNRNLVYTPNFLAEISAGGLVGKCARPRGGGPGVGDARRDHCGGGRRVRAPRMRPVGRVFAFPVMGTVGPIMAIRGRKADGMAHAVRVVGWRPTTTGICIPVVPMWYPIEKRA